MSKKTKEEPKEKQYGLKPIELRLIESLQQSYFQNLSTTLSFIALERLAYPVTEYTRFRIEDGKLFVQDVIPEAPKEEVKVA